MVSSCSLWRRTLCFFFARRGSGMNADRRADEGAARGAADKWQGVWGWGHPGTTPRCLVSVREAW